MTRIRALTASDWPRVAEVYAEGIATGQATFENDIPSWERWDESHHAHSRLVAERDGVIVGFAALLPVSKRAVYAGVAEASVYVAADARRLGVGAELLAALIRSSEQEGIWTLQASIFPENEASFRLVSRAGFRVVGRRDRIGKHQGVWRDTLLLERRA